MSDDGKWLAYTPHSRDTRSWKRYRGGMASDIWLFNLENNAAKQITDFEGTDSLPMWHGKTVYYLSDAGAEHRLNLWAYNTESNERRQVTKYKDYDCKWPSIGPGPNGKGEIVVQNGSDLLLVDLPTEKATPVKITIPGARPKLAPKKIDASEFITGADISPTGKRVVVEARGDIWTLPAKSGPPRNLTRTSGTAERDPSWSPDGRWIAYFSDATGEYELYVTQSDGLGETRQLTKDNSKFLFLPIWSPDSKFLTYCDKAGGLFLHNLEDAKTKQIATDPFSEQTSVNWSHNSEWLTYAISSDEKAPTTSVWVYNVNDSTHRKLTSGYFPDADPVFDRKGDHIFFTSHRAFNSPKYEDIGTSFIYSGTEVVLAMPLRADVKRPFMARSDEESWKKDADGKKTDKKKSDQAESEKTDKKAAENSSAPKEDADKKDTQKPGDEAAPAKDGKKESDEKSDKDSEKDADKIVIEFDDIERRVFQLPVGQGTFGTLAVNDKNQLLFATRGARGEDKPPAIKLLDLSADKAAAKTVVDGASTFAISSDGKKLMVFSRGKLHLISAAAGQKLAGSVSTDGMHVTVDPRAEWKQLFVDAWRIERDFFYDPNMHGLDWKAIRDQYEAMIDDCVSRRDVGFVIAEMIAEINVGHAYYREGDVESGPNGNVGLLGCRFEIQDNAFQVAELFQGAEWDVDARNPLSAVGVKAGEYILAVNGLPFKTDTNPYAAFQGLAGSTITLTVSADSKKDDKDRTVTIKPIRSDSNLRFRAWIERKRKYVAEKTDGKVGYIYVVNTGVPGQNDLVRQYYAQLNKQALIIDDRWNGGGQIPTRFIELLNRPVTNYWAKRDGRDWTWPPDAHHGPKCMLTNGMAGSGGDMFPALFRQAKLGKLIGMRTWGGLVGISGNPGLIDGASVTAPTFAYYELDGTWGIEGHGVDPDIKVVDDPSKMADGGDPQLDAAITQMLSEIEKSPYKKPARPAYPDRSKFGLNPADK